MRGLDSKNQYLRKGNRIAGASCKPTKEVDTFFLVYYLNYKKCKPKADICHGGVGRWARYDGDVLRVDEELGKEGDQEET